MWRFGVSFSLMWLLLSGFSAMHRAQAVPQAELLFAADGNGTVIHAQRGENIRQLSQAPRYRTIHFCPLASPDNHWIAFGVYYIESEMFLSVVDRFGRNEHHVLSSAYGDCSFIWSADSQWLYFMEWGGILKRVRVSDGKIEPVLNIPHADYTGMVLSPDGGWLAFDLDGSLTTIQLGTGKIRQANLRHDRITNIAWSEQGGIVYTGVTQLGKYTFYNLYRVDDTWHAHYLTYGYLARWSHDGKQIAYWTDDAVQVLSFDSTLPQRIPSVQGSQWRGYFTSNIYAPLWSEEDTALYWAECRYGAQLGSACGIMRYELATDKSHLSYYDCGQQADCTPDMTTPGLLPVTNASWHPYYLLGGTLGLGMSLGLGMWQRKRVVFG